MIRILPQNLVSFCLDISLFLFFSPYLLLYFCKGRFFCFIGVYFFTFILRGLVNRMVSKLV